MTRKVGIGHGIDETAEARIYAVTLSQTARDQRHAMADALAQAGSFLDELAALGRYVGDAAPEDRESDRLRLALALMRARREGLEDGAFLEAWWRDSVGDCPGAAPGEAGADGRSG